MKCLDTTYLIDYLEGTLKAQMPPQEYCTTQINVYEILVGIHRRNSPKKAEQLARTERFFREVHILPLTDSAVRLAAEIGGMLVRSGKELGQNDCMIAAIALTHGVSTVITKNISDHAVILSKLFA